MIINVIFYIEFQMQSLFSQYKWVLASVGDSIGFGDMSIEPIIVYNITIEKCLGQLRAALSKYSLFPLILQVIQNPRELLYNRTFQSSFLKFV